MLNVFYYNTGYRWPDDCTSIRMEQCKASFYSSFITIKYVSNVESSGVHFIFSAYLMFRNIQIILRKHQSLRYQAYRYLNIIIQYFRFIYYPFWSWRTTSSFSYSNVKQLKKLLILDLTRCLVFGSHVDSTTSLTAISRKHW